MGLKRYKVACYTTKVVVESVFEPIYALDEEAALTIVRDSFPHLTPIYATEVEESLHIGRDVDHSYEGSYDGKKS